MSTQKDNVQSASDSYQAGQTVTIGGSDYTIDSVNDDGSITLSGNGDSFTVVQVDEGTSGAVEYNGSWWLEK